MGMVIAYAEDMERNGSIPTDAMVICESEADVETMLRYPATLAFFLYHGDDELRDVVDVIVTRDRWDTYDVSVTYEPHSTWCEWNTPAECTAALASDIADDAAAARACIAHHAEPTHLVTVKLAPCFFAFDAQSMRIHKVH